MRLYFFKKIARNLLLFSLLIVLCISCDQKNLEVVFESKWHLVDQRIWIGKDYWANRMSDWEIIDGKLVCINENPKKTYRTLHWLSGRLNSSGEKFISELEINYFSEPDNTSKKASAGLFISGVGEGMDYRDVVTHRGEGLEGNLGIYIGVSKNSELFVKKFSKDSIRTLKKNKIERPLPRSFYFQISITSSEENSANLTVNVFGDQTKSKSLANIQMNTHSDLLSGNVAIVSHPGASGETAQLYEFSDWKMYGDRIHLYPERTYGPIVSSRYYFEQDSCFLISNLMPTAKREVSNTILQLNQRGEWLTVDTADIVFPGLVSQHKFQFLNKDGEVPYRVAYKSLEDNKISFDYGIIKRPLPEKELNLLAIIGSPSYPKYIVKQRFGKLENILADMKEPDYLLVDEYFGDYFQGTSISFDNLYYNYSYQWYQWCWSFRELTSSVPSLLYSFEPEGMNFDVDSHLLKAGMPEWYFDAMKRIRFGDLEVESIQENDTIQIGSDMYSINSRDTISIADQVFFLNLLLHPVN